MVPLPSSSIASSANSQRKLRHRLNWGTCPLAARDARGGAFLVVITTSIRTHVNPVYGSYFADPFVWRHGDTFYAVGTGELEANGKAIGKVFPVLQSQDFYQWQPASSALVRPDPRLGTHFWAPEVAYAGGKFHLYYSVGFEDRDHQIRVAISDLPQGPYEDVGVTLIDPKHCAFAIDPHPYQDEDGSWYLFYARDFLDTKEGHRAGTGLMVTRLRSMTETDGPGAGILRPRHDWQRFQANRSMYGKNWDWHTVEGPFVLKRDGRYYCFFSGGRWECDTYGVDFAVADRVQGPYTDAGSSGSPRVLKTVLDHVIGPGHNSVVTGPDGTTDYIIYHAWDRALKARRMFIDKLRWLEEGPRCEGPTWGPGLDERTVGKT